MLTRSLLLRFCILTLTFGSLSAQNWGWPQTNLLRNMRERLQGFASEQSMETSEVVRQLTQSEPSQVPGYAQEITSKKANLGTESSAKKPTKYHHYPHNQHQFWLPECATQQVCNAVYTRLNFTQPLCACADRFRGPCSASLQKNDLHTLEVGLQKTSRAPTLVKTCEKTSDIRECRSPQDWALLALQNVRTGKSQYLVICRCEKGILDGPISHDQPAYARVPGIRVYGMMCNGPEVLEERKRNTRHRQQRSHDFPWEKIADFASTIEWD